jgi:hypothetical protein
LRHWLSTIPFCSQGAPEMDLLLENRPNEKFLSFEIKNIYNYNSGQPAARVPLLARGHNLIIILTPSKNFFLLFDSDDLVGQGYIFRRMKKGTSNMFSQKVVLEKKKVMSLLIKCQ